MKIHTREGMAKLVKVMTQEGGGDDVIMELQIAANNAADDGIQMYWHIDVIQPAMTPGMGVGVVPGLVVFSVMIHGRGGDEVVRKIVRTIGNGIRTVTRSCYATAWSEEMVAAGTLMLGNDSPTLVEPMLDEIGARSWMNRLMIPMRYAREPGDVRGGMEWVRIVVADKGADLQWLVDTGGDHDADGVARG